MSRLAMSICGNWSGSAGGGGKGEGTLTKITCGCAKQLDTLKYLLWHYFLHINIPIFPWKSTKFVPIQALSMTLSSIYTHFYGNWVPLAVMKTHSSIYRNAPQNGNFTYITCQSRDLHAAKPAAKFAHVL